MPEFFSRRLLHGKMQNPSKIKMSKKTRKIITSAVSVLALLIILTCIVYFVNAGRYEKVFLPGTIVNDVDISELNIDDAGKALSNTKRMDFTINLKNGQIVLDLKKMGLIYKDYSELYQLLRRQNIFTWFTREFGKPRQYSLYGGFKIDRKVLEEELDACEELQNYKVPENARINIIGTIVKIVPEKEGTKINRNKLTNEILGCLRDGKYTLDAEKDGVYVEPLVREKDLRPLKDEAEKILKTKLKVKFASGEQVIDYRTTSKWINLNKCEIDRTDILSHVEKFVAKIAQTDDTYGNFLPFVSTNFGLQTFSTNELHGHVLNQKETALLITEALLSGETSVEPVYSTYVDDYGIGNTYVEVDIYNQHIYYYEDGKLLYDCNCVSGTEENGGTPSGVYCVEEKEKGRDLVGYNSRGEVTYSVWVDYWIQFMPHYGLHDASWRDEFGGDIYLYDGSHGCINLPHKAAEYLYEKVEIGTPVVVFRGET